MKKQVDLDQKMYRIRRCIKKWTHFPFQYISNMYSIYKRRIILYETENLTVQNKFIFQNQYLFFLKFPPITISALSRPTRPDFLAKTVHRADLWPVFKIETVTEQTNFRFGFNQSDLARSVKVFPSVFTDSIQTNNFTVRIIQILFKRTITVCFHKQN